MSALDPYLLLDPLSCLACGAPAADGCAHICTACTQGAGDIHGRFTWRRTSAEAGTAVGKTAAAMGMTPASFTRAGPAGAAGA